MFPLVVTPGKDWWVYPGSFAAGTPNIQLKEGIPRNTYEKLQKAPAPLKWTRLSVKNLGEANKDKTGTAFLAAMGHAVHINVPAGETREIEVDYVLAIPDFADATITEAIASGEKEGGEYVQAGGPVLKYTAPPGGGYIVAQLRSLRKEAQQIALIGNLRSQCPEGVEAYGIEANFFEDAANDAKRRKAERKALAEEAVGVQADPAEQRKGQQQKESDDDSSGSEAEKAKKGKKDKSSLMQAAESHRPPQTDERSMDEHLEQLGLRGAGEAVDIKTGHTKFRFKEMRKARAQGKELQDMALKFWKRGDEAELLEACHCPALTNEHEDDVEGLCLKGSSEDLGVENGVCFRLHAGEVQVILKNRDSAIQSEPGSAIYFTAPLLTFDIDVGKNNAGIFKALQEYSSGEELIQNKFANTRGQPVAIGFGTVQTGDVIPIPMRRGDVWYLKPGSYVCGTANIVVTFERSLADSLQSKDGELFVMKVTLGVSPRDADNEQTKDMIRTGIFFAEGAGFIDMHRTKDSAKLVENHGLFVAGQAASGKLLEQDEGKAFDIDWLGSGARKESWHEKLMSGQDMMMQFGSMRDATGSSRDRVVVTQSQNFGSYAQKLVANMKGCPCIDLVNEVDQSPYGSSSLLQGESKTSPIGDGVDEPSHRARKAGIHGAISPQISTSGAWADIENSGQTLYKLHNGTIVQELGLSTGAAALSVKLPKAVPGVEVAIRGAGESLITSHQVIMKATTPDRIDLDFEGKMLSSSDQRWARFMSDLGQRGEAIITETGAEDLLRVDIKGKDAAWKVKTGHLLATTDEVKLEADWCGASRDPDYPDRPPVPLRGGFMMLVTYSDRARDENFAWVWGYGKLRHHVLSEGEHLVMDDGHIVAFTAGMPYGTSPAGGMTGIPFNDGSAMLAHFTGPGEVVSSSKNLKHFAKYLCPSALGA
jgi:uncharacterized protein (AIM24 family)